jgi:hypothetical protein
MEVRGLEFGRTPAKKAGINAIVTPMAELKALKRKTSVTDNARTNPVASLTKVVGLSGKIDYLEVNRSYI